MHARWYKPTQVKAPLEVGLLTSCIEECYDCSQACTSCADACLAEKDMQMLDRCIRLCLDCADVCLTTGRLMSRELEPDISILRSQLQACIVACQVCGAECRRHEGMMAHCRECADACQRCEMAYVEALRAL